MLDVGSRFVYRPTRTTWSPRSRHDLPCEDPDAAHLGVRQHGARRLRRGLTRIFVGFDQRDQAVEASKRPVSMARVPSRIAFSWARSLRLARRFEPAIIGATTFEKPDGSPRLRRVIRVPPDGVSAQV